MSEDTASEKNMSTHYEGVFTALRKSGESFYRASLTWHGKHISLGSFSSPEDAHAAYLEGRRVLSDPTCTPDAYGDDSLLSFEKWVCLANCRDNNIYFRNPIYVGRKMFYYYLSPSKALKFDVDDLFYFSSHKIMCRGNRYFVADYGLQVSVASRFRIKPYARPGKDFLFLNGDDTDFRRENIQILNVYHGVTAERKKGQYLYTVRIHVNGNHIVGRYPDEVQAAVAYNKAVDVLRKNGFRKNYAQNFVEELSPSRYAEIYSGLQISPGIAALRP